MIARTSAEPINDVRLVRNVLIPLRDGVTLAADVRLPETPGPHPTLMSFYPYRKDDIIGSFAAYACTWFAQRGYAHLLVDARGYGGSGGRRAESFHPLLESADTGDAVEWAAAQPWSTGAVGVWGVSYGGLTALAAAAARPAHLRAVAAVYPLWDIWADMAAFGGCPAMLGQHQWSTMMLAQGLAPPTFRDPAGRWLEVWHERLARIEQEGPEAAFWQAHPEPDEYWGERVLPLDRIEAPVFLVGGWRDLFPDAVARAYERIEAPKRLLLGPWLHIQPDVAAREPVDWLPLVLGFWNEHLGGGRAAADPPVLAFVQGDGGGWRGGTTWPPRGVETLTFHPASQGRLVSEADEGTDEYPATALVGVTGGQWDTLGTGMGYPLDQGPDDRRSLTYTSAPLADALEIGGRPEVFLDVERVEGAGPFDLVVKLVDVAPDGSAELVTTGWRRCAGGATSVELWATAWAFAAGHRVRLSVACADFPRIWPDPSRPTIRLARAGCSLRLPAVHAGIGEPFDPPRPAPVAAADRFPWTISGAPAWTIEQDLAHDGVAVTLGGGETMRLPEGGTLALRQQATARVEAAHPERAAVEGEVTIEIELPGGERATIESRSRAWRDRTLYHGRVEVDGRTLLDRSWRNF